VIIYFSRQLGQATVRNRLIGFTYMILVFFIIPFFLILFNKNSNSIPETPHPEVKEIKVGE